MLIIPTFHHTNHKRLWNWLYRNSKMCKYDWPGWSDITMYPERLTKHMTIINDCEACNYAVQEFSRVVLGRNIFSVHDAKSTFQEYMNNGVCKYCPFGAQVEPCFPEYNLYKLYSHNHFQERSDIALKIARLPIRTDMRVKVK